jgi:Ca-activated chloride channel homolog
VEAHPVSEALAGGWVHPEWAPLAGTGVALVALVVLASWARARRRAARLLGDASVVGARRLARDLAVLAALAAIATAALGPRLGTRLERMPGSGVDVVLLLDVSRSMDAADVPPSRLARARALALELLARLAPGDRAALAAFGGRGVLLTPLTPDHEALAELAAALDGELLADRASNLTDGVGAALRAFEAASERPRVLVVLSDGEDPAGGDDAAAAALARAGVRLVAIALGSEDGVVVPDGAAWLRDERGRTVVSRRDSERLARWAARGEGALFVGDRWGAIDLEAATAAVRRDAASAPGAEVARRVPAVQTAPLAALAFALLWLEWTGGLPALRRRRTEARTAASPRASRRRAAATAALGLAALVLAAAPPGAAEEAGVPPELREAADAIGLDPRALPPDPDPTPFRASRRRCARARATRSCSSPSASPAPSAATARAPPMPCAPPPSARATRRSPDWPGTTSGCSRSTPGSSRRRGTPSSSPSPSRPTTGRRASTWSGRCACSRRSRRPRRPAVRRKARSPTRSPRRSRRLGARRPARRARRPPRCRNRADRRRRALRRSSPTRRWSAGSTRCRTRRARRCAQRSRTTRGGCGGGRWRRGETVALRAEDALPPRRRGGVGVVGAFGASAEGVAIAPCRVEVSVEPARAFVGEQVVYRARVLRREEVREVRWLRAPSFPSLRSEWLPGRTTDPRIAGIGDAFVVSEDRRALFPVRAGAIEIPPAILGCRLASGAELEVAAPGAALVAEPVPDAGRPPDFAGVVGPVQVRAHVSTRHLQLGETLRLAVVVVGESNLWVAAPPLEPAGPDLDAYPQAPDLQLEPGERLRVRRTFVWELVPRRAGRLSLPAPRVPWFDPATGGYEGDGGPCPDRHGAAGRRGAASGPGGGGARGRGRGRTERPPRARADRAARAPRSGGGGAAHAAGWRRGGPLRAATPALAEAERALAAGDGEAAARALATALRAGLAQRVAGGEALAAEEIAAGAGGQGAIAEAAALLAGLDRVRFAGAGGGDALPPVDRVRAAIRALGPARAPR